MDDVIVGVLAVLVGVAFCFRGYLMMRVIIPLWGAFAGFVLGAGLISSGDDGFLVTGLSWVVGLAVALLFGALAYFYYAFSVLLVMSSIGFALGVALMTAIGIDWQWLVILAGIAVGVVLAVLAIAAEMPMLLLTVLTALGGASLVMGGLALILGGIDLDEIGDSGTLTSTINRGPWWFVVFGGLAVLGIVFQVRYLDDMRRTLRQQWDSERAD